MRAFIRVSDTLWKSENPVCTTIKLFDLFVTNKSIHKGLCGFLNQVFDNDLPIIGTTEISHGLLTWCRIKIY